MSDIIAILCADLHLSHKPPTARSVEPDWYGAMERTLSQLRALVDEHGSPVICAGDVFEHWNSPPELVNFAIDALPKMHAVPGQHDLPHHSYDDIDKSAYWTLVKAGVIVNLLECEFGRLKLHGFPWGKEVTEPGKEGRTLWHGGKALSVAVVHKYCWTSDLNSHAAAVEGNRLRSFAGKLRGYDVAVFGDNHKPFIALAGECTVFNCGCLIPRSMDERDHRPSIGLLKSGGHVERHYLDVSEDKWLDEAEDEIPAKQDMDLDGFLHELGELSADSLSFERALRRYIDEKLVRPAVRDVLLEVVEKLGG